MHWKQLCARRQRGERRHSIKEAARGGRPRAQRPLELAVVSDDAVEVARLVSSRPEVPVCLGCERILLCGRDHVGVQLHRRPRGAAAYLPDRWTQQVEFGGRFETCNSTSSPQSTGTPYGRGEHKSTTAWRSTARASRFCLVKSIPDSLRDWATSRAS